MRTGRRSFVFIGLLTALPGLAAGPSVLTVQDAWVRQVPGSDVAAVYLILRNPGSRPVAVREITCPVAQSAMIHETKVEGGQSQMRAEPSLLVPPGQTVVLAPGGRHVMLMGVKPLAVGQRVPLVLKLGDGTQVRVDAPVRPLTAP